MSKILDKIVLRDTKTGISTEYTIQDTQLKERVENLIANKNDTNGNSELIDIRTGFDGNKYDTAGDAVRSQVSNLQEQVNDINNNGLIFNDDYISLKIDTWLKDHPEATTTVLDNSITKEKIEEDFLYDLRKARFYNSVADMKLDSELKAGQVCKTLGYYSTNDGGGAYYVIRAKQDSDVDDGGSLHELANGLVAELIIENSTVNVKDFGAKGDGAAHIVDSVDIELMALNNAATAAYNSNKILYIPEGIYNISDSWVIDKNIQVHCDGKIYFTGGAKPCVVLDSLDGCNGANIYIDTIESQHTSFVYDATNTNTNIGVLVKNTKRCDIKINYIESFIIAVKMFAENAGTYYNKINLKYAKGCYFVYDLLTHSDTSKHSAFCNANMFYDTVWLYNANWSNQQLLPYFVKNKVIYDGAEAEYPPHIDNTNYFINLMVEYNGTSSTYPRLVNLTQCRDFHINFKRIEINTGGSTHRQGEITNAIIGDGYTSECEINIEFSWNTIAINFAGDSNRIYTKGTSIKRIKVTVTFTAAANSYGLIRLPIDPSYKITNDRIIAVKTLPWEYSNMKGLQITNGVVDDNNNELALSYYTPVEANAQTIEFTIWYV